jgi:hypothetical protein
MSSSSPLVVAGDEFGRDRGESPMAFAARSSGGGERGLAARARGSGGDRMRPRREVELVTAIAGSVMARWSSWLWWLSASSFSGGDRSWPRWTRREIEPAAIADWACEARRCDKARPRRCWLNRSVVIGRLPPNRLDHPATALACHAG